MRKMVVVVAALKGGVGKTTTSVYLSALAAESGQSVSLVDADSQASAADWLDSSEDNRLAPVSFVEAPTERLVAKALDATKAGEVAIVDTPPGHDRLLAKALEWADVVVVPTRVGGVETPRVEAVLDMVLKKVPVGLAVCSARTHTMDYQEVVKAWAKARVPVWGTVPERVAIAAGPEARLSWEGIAAYRGLWRRVLRVSAP
jgi:chromosome partitioning protein